MTEHGLPALTDAEAALVEHYARVLALLGRINPARTGSTPAGCRQAADALVSEARALRDALARMQERGEDEVFGTTLARTLRHLDVDRYAARLGTHP